MPQITYDPTTVPASGSDAAPNAQGANFTPAVGQALEGLGQQGSRLASDMARIDYQRKQADQVTSLTKNLMDGDEQFNKITEQLKATSGQPNSGIAENGDGYVSKLKEQFEPWANKLVDQQTDPRVQRIAIERIGAMHNRLFNNAVNWEMATGRAWRISGIDDGITHDATAVQQDPSQYDERLKGQLDTINTLSGELHPEDKIALRKRAQQQLAEGASLGFVQAMPSKAAAILTGEHPLPPDSIQAKIVAEAKSKGVDPNTALAQAQLESSMRPDVGSNVPGHTARGLFGQIDSSWAQYSGGADRGDVDAQVKSGIAQMADSQKALRQSLGRDPTPYDQRLAHWFGIGAAPAIIRAPDSQPFGELLTKAGYREPSKVLSQNGLNAQSTVGDVKHLVQVNMDKAMTATAGFANAPEPDKGSTTDNMPAFLAQLTPPGRAAMLSHAQTLMRKDRSVERTQIEAQFNDASAAWERGEGAKDPPSLAQWQSAYGPQIGLMKYQHQSQLQDFGAQYAKVATANPEQQQAIYESSKGSTSATGMQLHDMIGQAINRVNTERAADPVGFDQVKGLKTTTPLDFSDPSKLVPQLSARYEQSAQIAQQFGTPYEPLSKDEALKFSNFVANAKPSQVQDYLASAKVAANANPEHYMALLGQIAPNHPAIAHAGAIADQNPQAAAMVLQGAAMLKPQGEKKEVSIVMPPEGAFRKAWQDTGATEAYAGNQRESDMAMQAAMAYYTAAYPISQRNDKTVDADTWKKAVEATTGGVIEYGTGKTLAPYGMKPSDFPDAVSKVWPTIMSQAGLDPKDHSPQSYTMTDIGPGQYAVTSGSGYLPGKDGQPVVFDLLKGQLMTGNQELPPPIPRKPEKVATDSLPMMRGRGR
jgi:hypothetical protein